jgi:FkbM family methyltransferase
MFRLEHAVLNDGEMQRGPSGLEVTTPAAPWSYAVSLAAEWVTQAPQHPSPDGIVRLRFASVKGEISVLALATADTVLDEVRVGPTDAPVEIELIVIPRDACQSIVIRNGQSDGEPSRAVLESIECADLDAGPSTSGDEVAAPDPLTWSPVNDWPDYYRGRCRSRAERIRSVRYSQFTGVKRMPWLDGLTVHIWPNDDLSRVLYVSGTYEPNTMLVMRRWLMSGATFIDVGANVGMFSMVASQLVGWAGRVYAFEPSERERQRLVANLAMNALENVTIVPRAVADRETSLQLRIGKFPHAGQNTTAGSFAYPDVAVERIQTVETISLDAFAQSRGLQRIDAIKFDIEGGECAALAGATNVLARFRPRLILELSPDAVQSHGVSPQGVTARVQAAGYRIYRVGAEAQIVPFDAGGHNDEGNVIAVPSEQAP